MEAHASSEFPPTSVFVDYLTAAVLASSNSLIYKRVKPNQVIEWWECDDMRDTHRLRITGLLTHGLSFLLISFSITYGLKGCKSTLLSICTLNTECSCASKQIRWEERAKRGRQRVQRHAAAMQWQKCNLNIMSSFSQCSKFALVLLFRVVHFRKQLHKLIGKEGRLV